jgi:DNA polymerase
VNIITLDFETYYDDDYSLKKMTTEAYVRDPRFEVLGMGIRYHDGRADWTSEYVQEALEDWNVASSAVLCHHAQFDGLILSHHFNIRPKLWLDSLSMARLVVGNHLSVSLDNLAKHFGLHGKTIDYKSFKGKHWHELTPAEQQGLADGCLHDVELTWELFNRLMVGFPDEELRVVDLTIRMFVEPVLEGDVELLARVWMDEERRKRDALTELGVTEADLQSAEHFAELLRAEGIEPDTKISPRTSGDVYCFAKTDDWMKQMIEEDSRAGALCRARLGIKSTLNQTRAERLGWMAVRGRK